MPRNYRSLKRAAIRPDWNKYTLFNLSRLQAPRFNRLTFFQQKWKAKSDLRAYHSPYVREGYWERLFDRRLPGVVSMNYRYLATHDGSELAAGRGSGLTSEEDGIIKEEQGQTGTTKLARTPYMAMAFFPLERRLDTAIWRALFASSTRQARMLVAHGAVQVNGRKMIHPGYLLNPGDMFTVEKEKVMFATGARKRSKISTKPWDRREMSKSHPLTEDTTQTSGEQRIRARQAEKEAARLETLEESKENTKAEDGDMKDNEVKATSEKSPVDVDPAKEARSELKKLRDLAEEILQIGKKELSGKRLQALRAFTSDVNKSLSRASHRDVSITESLNEMEGLTKVFNELYETLPTTVLPAKDRAKKKEEFMTELAVQKETTRMIAALEKARENPIDSTLPYASPWTPRPYMSAFAFIPRYLEVNQNICSAVYLRHPVARPGLAEVPTPFHYETSQLGFNWYLRRR